jgi:hypothetical protein
VRELGTVRAITTRNDSGKSFVRAPSGLLRRLTAAAFVAALIAPGRARAACEPARITIEPAAPSEEWQPAVEELRRALAREGMPWSCVGGAVALHLDEEGRPAAVRFRDPAGREEKRHVPSPRELVSTTEALLSRTTPAELSSTAPATPPISAAPAALDPRSAPALAASRPALPREPRFLASVMAGIRYGGPPRAVWFAPELRATIPVDAWSAGLWLRYAIPYTFDAVLPDFSMSQVNLGFAGGRRLLDSPLEVRLTVDPSIAVISMEGGSGENLASGAKIDFQIGLGLSAALPITTTWRGVIRLDGGISPESLGKERRIDPSLPPLPAYQIGASIGVEALVR